MKSKIASHAFTAFVAVLALAVATFGQAGKNPESIALLKFYPAAQGNSFATGSGPSSVGFDGSSVWVGNALGLSVTKRRASDGALLGTFKTPTAAPELVFDGANVWVANPILGSVTKVRASDGVQLGTFAAGQTPGGGMAFDGVNVWISNTDANTITK